MALANIRAFLLTGEEQYQKDYLTYWDNNVKRYAELSNNAHLLSPDQRAAFNKFSAARNKFKDLPQKMFDIRDGNEWNLANYWLGAKAAPRAGKLVTELSEIISNQRTLAANDVDAAQTAGTDLRNFMVLLGIISVAIAIVVSFFIVRNDHQTGSHCCGRIERNRRGQPDPTLGGFI